MDSSPKSSPSHETLPSLLYLQNNISSEQTWAAYNLHNYTIPDLQGFHGTVEPTTGQLGVPLYAVAGIGIVVAVGVLIIYLWILRRHLIHT